MSLLDLDHTNVGERHFFEVGIFQNAG